jgi:hypothetical protein
MCVKPTSVVQTFQKFRLIYLSSSDLQRRNPNADFAGTVLILVNLENVAPKHGFGSGFEDSDPFSDRILRPKDPEPDSVGFGFAPTTNPESQDQIDQKSRIRSR